MPLTEFAAVRTRAFALVALVLVVSAAPVWLSERFPSQDGPAHLGAAAAIAGYPAELQRPLDRYVDVRLTPGRSPLGHLLLAGLVRLAGPRPGERLFLTGLLLLAVAAGWYAASAVRADGGSFAVLLLPVVTGRLFHLGFWDFLLGLCGLLAVLGFWLRRHRAPSDAHLLGLGTLLLLTAALHPSAAPVATAAVVASAALGRGASVPGVARVAASAIPAMALAALVATQEDKAGPAPALGRSLGDLAGVTVLRATRDGREVALSLAVVATLALLVAGALPALAGRVRRRAPDAADGLLVVAGLALALVFVGPRTFWGAGFLNHRYAAYGLVLVVLWAAAQARGRPPAVPLIAAAAAVVAVVAVRAGYYEEFDGDLGEIATAMPAMVPGRTVVALLPEDGGLRPTERLLFNPLRHVGGVLAAERHLIDLGNYEGSCDYFPFAYRPARDPLAHLFVGRRRCPEPLPAEIDPRRYMARTDGQVDYVVVIGRPGVRLRRALDGLYQRVLVTRPRGLASVWRLEAGG